MPEASDLDNIDLVSPFLVEIIKASCGVKRAQ